MSDTTKKSAETTSGSKFSIVRAISAFLKLGEDGKLDSFFTRVVKSLTKEITAHKQNLKNLEFNHSQKIDELDDKLEDAQTALDEAYMKVDMEKIGTNESQSRFQEVYLENIDNHEVAVKLAEGAIEAENKSYESSKKSIEEQIESLNKRIRKVSAE